jgi:hypothetical protein
MVTDNNLQYLYSLRADDITKQDVIKLFSNTLGVTTEGKKEVLPPMFYPSEEITIPANCIANVKENTKTTVGLYFFNMFFMAGCFGELIPYINKTINNSDLKKLASIIVNNILEDKITTIQFGTYQQRLIWFNNFSELLMPGMSLNMITPNKKLMDLKKKLLEENKVAVKNGNIVQYVQKVEKPLLKAAEEEFKNDYSWPLYAIKGKPSFGNNYKNTLLEVGPILNSATGKYEISSDSFMDGIPPDKYYLFANLAIYGSFNRGVATQYAGAKTKELFAAMQSVSLDVPGSDCHTPFVKEITLTEQNTKEYMWRYIKEGPDVVLLTPEVIKTYIGKKVRMRSPLFCFGDKICNVCAGDLFNRLGMTNIGLATTKITSTFLNMSLKSMHDTTVNAVDFDPKNYFSKVIE